MDTPLPSKGNRKGLVVALIAIGCLVATSFSYRLVAADRAVVSRKADHAIGVVTEGAFALGTSFLATIEPTKKQILATSVSGTIKGLAMQAGTRVSENALIAELANPQIEMELLAREAEVAQQVANLNSQEMQVQQQEFDYARQITQARIDLANAESTAERNNTLVAAGMIASAVAERTRRDVEFVRSQLELLGKSASSFRLLAKKSIVEQRDSVAHLKHGLQLSRSIANQLQVRSPIAGVLMNVTVERGQFVGAGTAIGAVGDDSDVRLAAKLDEYYLSRVRVGQRGTATFAGKSVDVEVSRVVAQVSDRKFQLELKTLRPLANATLGQNVPVVLAFSDEQRVLKLPIGPYLSETGGDWVFVVSHDGRDASRRAVRLGERNDREVVVLAGLSPDERVLISSYRELLTHERVKFN